MQIFKSSDGSEWSVSSAREVSNIPVWQGNRVIDRNHANTIENSVQHCIKSLDTNPFRIARIKEDSTVMDCGAGMSMIIDGQHRCSVLANYFKNNPAFPDFPVLVATKTFDTENDIIGYFRILNSTKAIDWKEDPVMIANTYLQALSNEFDRRGNARVNRVLRSGRTLRPFLSLDRLREYIVSRHIYEWIKTPEQFVERARLANTQALANLRSLTVLSDMQARALLYSFGLGLDLSFSWLLC